MYPSILLRAEGLGVFIASAVAYHGLEGPLWLFLLLLLAPDVSMVGYLGGPWWGSITYNAAHTYLTPIILAAAGVGFAVESVLLGALIWSAHIGIDRLVGYGLKYPTAFSDTHLSSPAIYQSRMPKIETEPTD